MPDVSLICRKYQKGVIQVVILKQTDSDTFRSMSSMNYAASIEKKGNTYKSLLQDQVNKERMAPGPLSSCEDS